MVIGNILMMAAQIFNIEYFLLSEWYGDEKHNRLGYFFLFLNMFNE